MTNDPKDNTVEAPEFDALTEALETARALHARAGSPGVPVEQASFFVQQIQAYALLAIAERLDAQSNDVAAIANMMADFLQEREAEANRMVGGNN